MRVTVAVKAFLAHRRVTCVASTLVRYEADLDIWLTWRSARAEQYGPCIQDVTITELRALLAERSATCSAWTVRSLRRTLQGLWNFLAYETDAHGRPVLTDVQQTFFRNNRLPNPRVPTEERPALTPEQLEALLEAAGDGADEESARNRAIMLLLWESGLRVHELAKLTQADVRLAERTAYVIGKGNRPDAVFWGPRASAALRRYLALRRGPRDHGPLFRGVSTRNDGGAVTANLVRLCIKRIAADAGITLPKGSPCHCFRHGFARELRRRGLTRAQVGELLRDRTPAVVDSYLGLDIAPRRQVHRQAFGEMPPRPAAE
jgi:integrase/recombinase XerD